MASWAHWVIFMDNLENIFVLIIHSVLNRLNFSVWSSIFIITVKAFVISIGVFVGIGIVYNSARATALRTSLLVTITRPCDAGAFTHAIHVTWEYLCDRGAVLHFHCTFFSWLMVWIEGSIINTGHFVLIRWHVFIRWITSWTGNSHVLSSCFVSFVVRINFLFRTFEF